MFAGDHPCEKCVVVHNNWIVSLEAKIYRFKEHHMWAVDGPNLYYTEPSRKYIIYDNPAILGRGNDIVKNDEKKLPDQCFSHRYHFKPHSNPSTLSLWKQYGSPLPTQLKI